MDIFIDPASLPHDVGGFVQVLFLGAVYGYLLLQGSGLISEGSELLLLIPELAGVVGSVVLPVLGAVPDGAIVLFSGMGPADEVEEQLKVGVGALAGSTVMLLTVPWFLSLMGGRVPIIDGEPLYNRKRRISMTGRQVAGVCFSSGVSCQASIKKNAWVMIITGILGYAVVEIPALAFMNETKNTASKDINPFAWAGLAMCAVMFLGYLWLQFRLAKAPTPSEADSTPAMSLTTEIVEAKTNTIAARAICEKAVNLRGVLYFAMEDVKRGGTASQPLTGASLEEALKAKLRGVIKPFFARFDLDQSGVLNREELSAMAFTLGERVQASEFDTLFAEIDTDGSGSIDYEECISWLAKHVGAHREFDQGRIARSASSPAAVSSGAIATLAAVQVEVNQGDNDDEDDDEEEPECPEDFRDLPVDQQRRQILRRSLYQMGCGTLVVLLLSDPMVDVLNSIGERTSIPAFYVAFLLAPLASNASEMVASYAYAQKKTQKTISISFGQLLGAACMNNTFCLAIFYLLVAMRGLTWTYHAEVIGIIFVEAAMALVAMRRVHTLFHGVLVMSLLPLSLILVYTLKATVFNGKE
eukprot:TRINITY_DN4692_c0_g3_i1.p1 TRINITY_DN4692_c0_g3~~TRINITY_DN4692_c0_g3_i1.p1  ORF type:complete len:585 (-),score=110.43 TRINITY_DN4692_c0_g3_i1:434-2188(-)